MTKRILIFPAGMPRALAYLETALTQGQQVIGSSSLGHDPARERYPEWVYLPYVTSDNFDQALQQAIADHDIGGIFTPNPVVWDYLNRNLGKLSPSVKLINASPVESEIAPYHKAQEFGRSITEAPLELWTAATSQPPASALEIAALFRHAEGIPGMCDHEKIRALCDVFRHTPRGDIVEIGSWWGKSAFVLSWLAQCYGIGKLLCVDPWTAEHLVQENKKGLIDQIAWDASEALLVFQINLLPYSHGSVNYLRLPSIEAAVEYQHNALVATATFGKTQYAGRIAILHVDGNHSYENARADVSAWAGLVLPGGWIVIDDYVWPYGNGPQRAGDEFLATHHEKISLAFVMGSALFIQLTTRI